MPDTRTYYVISDDNCKFESMTREQILAAITQAIEQGDISDIDTGFVTKLKEMNRNNALKFWIGTTAEYNAIQTKETNCFYILSDDTELDDLETAISSINSSIETFNAQITSLNTSVTDMQEDITELQTASETYGDKFRIIDAMQDWLILDDSVEYGSTYEPLLMPHDEELPQITICDFRVVKVKVTGDEILCNVYKVSDELCYIRGISGGNASTSALAITVINLTCTDDGASSWLTENNSIVYDPSNNSKARLTITKIVGVE